MNIAATMQIFLEALQIIREGPEPAEMPGTLLYMSADNWHDHTVRTFSGIAAGRGSGGVLAVFDPMRIEEGPIHVGFSFETQDAFRMRFGQLWLAPGHDRALLVPRDLGRRCGHYGIEAGRIVHHAGWPAVDLAAGTMRAKRCLLGLNEILEQDAAASAA